MRERLTYKNATHPKKGNGDLITIETPKTTILKYLVANPFLKINSKQQMPLQHPKYLLEGLIINKIINLKGLTVEKIK